MAKMSAEMKAFLKRNGRFPRKGELGGRNTMAKGKGKGNGGKRGHSKKGSRPNPNKNRIGQGTLVGGLFSAGRLVSEPGGGYNGNAYAPPGDIVLGKAYADQELADRALALGHAVGERVAHTEVILPVIIGLSWDAYGPKKVRNSIAKAINKLHIVKVS